MTTKLLKSPYPKGNGGDADASRQFDLTERRVTVDWTFSILEKRYTTINRKQLPVGTLGLFVPSQGIEIVVDLFTFNYVGRSYPYSEYFDGIDFSAFGAYRLGVSRQHTAFIYENSQLLIVDKDSTNGTYLNRAVLEPYVPYQVKNNDAVQLGGFEFVVKLD
ncbi:MAG: FHA domain-containing protein [Chloroflexota bacterium]